MLIYLKKCFGWKKYFITFADLNARWCNWQHVCFWYRRV